MEAMKAVSLYLPLLLIVLILPGHQNDALICYENDETGRVYEVSNDSWNYCVIIPSSPIRKDNGRLFGVGPDSDSTSSYEYAFALSDDIYKILTLCLLEKYDFGILAKNSKKRFEAEYIFRCVCNYDRCNSAMKFSDYFHNIIEQNEK